MATKSFHGSAQVIQFPVRARATVGGHRDERKRAVEPTPHRVAKVAGGGAWYHEDAIQDGEHTRVK